jgi:hypothetical protein
MHDAHLEYLRKRNPHKDGDTQSTSKNLMPIMEHLKFEGKSHVKKNYPLDSDIPEKKLPLTVKILELRFAISWRNVLVHW